PNEAYCPYDENYNVIENNTFFSTNKDRDGNGISAGAVAFGIQDVNFPRDIGHNTFRNNIFAGGYGVYGTNATGQEDYPPVYYYGLTTDWLATSTFDHNIFWSLKGDSFVVGLGPAPNNG